MESIQSGLESLDGILNFQLIHMARPTAKVGLRTLSMRLARRMVITITAIAPHRKRLFLGNRLYDPDRMRYSSEMVHVRFDKQDRGQSLGIRVEMNGSPETYSVSLQHWYGMPFGIWRLDPKTLENARFQESHTPFSANDRAKAVFDIKRQRILVYGAAHNKERDTKFNSQYGFGKEGQCSALWAYEPASEK